MSHKIIIAVCVIRLEQVEMLSFRLLSENLRFEIAKYKLPNYFVLVALVADATSCEPCLHPVLTTILQ